MVAITVVLAAVLYVMVTGLIGGGSALPPTVDFVPSPVDAQTWTAQVQMDRSSGLNNFEVSLWNETSGSFCISETDLTSGFNATCDANVVLAFQDDASPGTNTLNGGDSFRLSGITPGNKYTINLVWKPNGGIIKSVTLPVT